MPSFQPGDRCRLPEGATFGDYDDTGHKWVDCGGHEATVLRIETIGEGKWAETIWLKVDGLESTGAIPFTRRYWPEVLDA